MARLGDLVFDSARPAVAARFWAAALDDYQVAPYDQAELDRLRQLGITDVEDDPTVLVQPLGAGPRLWFQLVPEAKTAKNRMHPDLFAADLEAEVSRLIGIGASVASRYQDHVVLADPDGNEFCLFPAG
jgi:hypothetical protein